jgi:quinol monooxygenase YgiN
MPTSPAASRPVRDAGGMVGVVARFKALPGKEEAALAMFREFTAGVKETEPGTLVYVFLRGRTDPQEIIVLEIYADADGRKAHAESPAITAAKARLPGLVDMASFKVEPIDDAHFGFIR